MDYEEPLVLNSLVLMATLPCKLNCIKIIVCKVTDDVLYQGNVRYFCLFLSIVDDLNLTDCENIVITYNWALGYRKLSLKNIKVKIKNQKYILWQVSMNIHANAICEKGNALISSEDALGAMLKSIGMTS